MQSRKMIQQAQRGFTLIELMIVVAIIGILAAVAIPQYQDYTIKAKMANSLTSVGALKTAVELCVQEAGGVTTDCDTTGAVETAIPVFSATKEIESATVADGTITVTMADGIANEVDGLAYTMIPTVNPSGITWAIGTGAGTTITKPTALAALRKNNLTAAASGGGST